MNKTDKIKDLKLMLHIIRKKNRNNAIILIISQNLYFLYFRYLL